MKSILFYDILFTVTNNYERTFLACSCKVNNLEAKIQRVEK
jgi:hypothetical protein